ncbi:MAG: DUF1287 domain-containing protein [Deltaproteobacteria bacterium]|nr:DUF1287 domain-containing protein [Deltaproteobacteria bacterium]
MFGAPAQRSTIEVPVRVQLGGGMRLGGGRQRPSGGGWWLRLVVLATLGFGASLWFTEIGADLDGVSPSPTAAAAITPIAAGTKGNGAASATAAAPSTRAAVAGAPAGPAEVAPPRLAAPAIDPVRRALLGAARDHVARGVYATRGSVPDLRAIKGSSVDLVERALDRVDFPLRAALLAHRAREPRRYGLKSRPGANDDPLRVLDAANLAAFLDAYAQRVEAVGDADLLPGDLVLFKPRRGKTQFAVVSERTDARGVSLLFTLDPADGVAKDQRARDAVTIERHWRLESPSLGEARRQLGLPRAPRGATG